MNALRREWDRLGIYLLLMTFGAYSTVYPIISFERVAPHWAQIMLGVEFFLAGLLLTVGMIGRHRFRLAGLVVVALGLSTISLVIALQGGARVLAYAFLFGAFAMQSVSDILRERREHQERKKLTKELEALTNVTGQGEGR